MFKAISIILALLLVACGGTIEARDIAPKGTGPPDGPCPKEGFLSDPNVAQPLPCATSCKIVRRRGETAKLAGPANCLECCYTARFTPRAKIKTSLPTKPTNQELQRGEKATTSTTTGNYQIALAVIVALVFIGSVVLLVLCRRRRERERCPYVTTEECQGVMITAKNVACSGVDV